MIFKKLFLTACLALVGGFSLVGCDEPEDTAATAADSVEESAESAGEGIEDMGEDAGEAIEDMGDEVEE